MYYWTNHQPAKHTFIPIPASLNQKFPAPVFHYLGFFINDEDLLTGCTPGEAILRLKGNMIVAGTWPFPNEPQDRLVAERGYGYMQDNGEVKAGEGAYIHVAMYDLLANQLSELTPVRRFF